MDIKFTYYLDPYLLETEDRILLDEWLKLHLRADSIAMDDVYFDVHTNNMVKVSFTQLEGKDIFGVSFYIDHAHIPDTVSDLIKKKGSKYVL